MNVRYMAAILAVALFACVERSLAPAVAIDAEALTEAVVPAAEAPWRALVDMEIVFQAPPPLDVSEIAAQPTHPPQSAVTAGADLDLGPKKQWDEIGLCAPPLAPNACARVTEDAGGAMTSIWRYEYEGELPTLVAARRRGLGDHIERCWRDSRGRITRAQWHFQSRSVEEDDGGGWYRGGCGHWYASGEHQGYDEHGLRSFTETLNAEFGATLLRANATARDGVINVYETTYTQGYPTRIVNYHEDFGVGFDHVASILTLAWSNGLPTRIDEYKRGGGWQRTQLYIWAGDYVRYCQLEVDTSSGPYSEPQVVCQGRETIFRRRGNNDYVPVFEAPDTRWEYETAAGVETTTKYVGELIVERQRDTNDGGVRRRLSVERRLPDVEGLVTVERWDWSLADRVVVAVPDGRQTYLLDCSELPPIEQEHDPNCPPPLPVREWTEMPRPLPVVYEIERDDHGDDDIY